jgi:pimeloyl-ACP methyl ester carboxylesterase
MAEVNAPNVSPALSLHLLFPTSAGAAAARRFVTALTTTPQEPVSAVTLSRQGAAETAFLHYDTVWNDLSAIRVPTMVTNGSDDFAVPPAIARTLAARIPKAQLSLFAECGHGMMFQDVNRFVRLVVTFDRTSCTRIGSKCR